MPRRENGEATFSETTNNGNNYQVCPAVMWTQTVTAPMVQERGPHGPMVVFRPWPLDDRRGKRRHVPPASQGGENLAKEVLTICQQYTPTLVGVRLLLVNHLTAGEFAKIRAKAEVDEEPREADWNHAGNAAYRNAVNDLCAAMRDAFPKKVNMTHRRHPPAYR